MEAEPEEGTACGAIVPVGRCTADALDPHVQLLIDQALGREHASHVKELLLKEWRKHYPPANGEQPSPPLAASTSSHLPSGQAAHQTPWIRDLMSLLRPGVPQHLTGSSELQGIMAAITMTMALAREGAGGTLPKQLLSMLSPFRSHVEELRPLGKGGFGSVVLVRNRLDNKLMAVKQVPFKSPLPPWTAPELMEKRHARLLREVRALANLDFSPYVVHYHHAWLEPCWEQMGQALQQQQQEKQRRDAAAGSRPQGPRRRQQPRDFAGGLAGEAESGMANVAKALGLPARGYVRQLAAGVTVGCSVPPLLEVLPTPGAAPHHAHSTTHMQPAFIVQGPSSSDGSDDTLSHGDGSTASLNAKTAMLGGAGVRRQASDSNPPLLDGFCDDEDEDEKDDDGGWSDEEEPSDDDDDDDGDYDDGDESQASDGGSGYVERSASSASRSGLVDSSGTSRNSAFTFARDEASSAGASAWARLPRVASAAAVQITELTDSDEESSSGSGSSSSSGGGGNSGGGSSSMSGPGQGGSLSRSSDGPSSGGGAESSEPASSGSRLRNRHRELILSPLRFHSMPLTRPVTLLQQQQQQQRRRQPRRPDNNGMGAGRALLPLPKRQGSTGMKWPYTLYIAMEAVPGVSLDVWLLNRVRSYLPAPASPEPGPGLLPADAEDLRCRGGAADPAVVASAASAAPAAGLGCTEQDIFRQLVLGLLHCHSAGIIHRDLKPSNILVVSVASMEQQSYTQQSQQPRPGGFAGPAAAAGSPGCIVSRVHVKIADFGLAVDEELRERPVLRRGSGGADAGAGEGSGRGTRGTAGSAAGSGTGGGSGSGHEGGGGWTRPGIGSGSSGCSAPRTSGVGTASYSAPEQLHGDGQYGPAVDMFPLGLILMELCCPFATGMERAMAMREARAGRLPPAMQHCLPKEAELARCLVSDDPGARPSVWQLLQRLDEMWFAPQPGGRGSVGPIVEVGCLGSGSGSGGSKLGSAAAGGGAAATVVVELPDSSESDATSLGLRSASMASDGSELRAPASFAARLLPLAGGAAGCEQRARRPLSSGCSAVPDEARAVTGTCHDRARPAVGTGCLPERPCATVSSSHAYQEGDGAESQQCSQPAAPCTAEDACARGASYCTYRARQYTLDEILELLYARDAEVEALRGQLEQLQQRLKG